MALGGVCALAARGVVFQVLHKPRAQTGDVWVHKTCGAAAAFIAARRLAMMRLIEINKPTKDTKLIRQFRQ